MGKTKAACTNCKKAHVKCGDQRPCIRCIENKIGESCKDSAKRIMYDLGTTSISFHPSPTAQNQKSKHISTNSISPPKKQRKQQHNQQQIQKPQEIQAQQIYIPIQHKPLQEVQVQQIQEVQQHTLPIPTPLTSFVENLGHSYDTPDWIHDAPIVIENLEEIILLESNVDNPILANSSLFYSSTPPPTWTPSPCPSPSSSTSSNSPNSPTYDASHRSSPTTCSSLTYSSSPVDPSSPADTSFSYFSNSYSSSLQDSYAVLSTFSSSSPPLPSSSPLSPSLPLSMSFDHDPNLLDDLSFAISVEMQEAELRWKNANNMRNVLNQIRLGIDYPQVEVIITELAQLSIVSCNKSFATMLSMPLDLLQNSHPQIIALMPAPHPRRSKWTMPSVITLQKAFKGADGTIKYCAVTICQKGHYSHSVVVSHESVSQGHAVPPSLRHVPIFGIQTIAS